LWAWYGLPDEKQSLRQGAAASMLRLTSLLELR
jgi:hypothetical protein